MHELLALANEFQGTKDKDEALKIARKFLRSCFANECLEFDLNSNELGDSGASESFKIEFPYDFRNGQLYDFEKLEVEVLVGYRHVRAKIFADTVNFGIIRKTFSVELDFLKEVLFFFAIASSLRDLEFKSPECVDASVELERLAKSLVKNCMACLPI
jgi:hypothetical protein